MAILGNEVEDKIVGLAEVVPDAEDVVILLKVEVGVLAVQKHPATNPGVVAAAAQAAVASTPGGVAAEAEVEEEEAVDLQDAGEGVQ